MEFSRFSGCLLLFPLLLASFLLLQLHRQAIVEENFGGGGECLVGVPTAELAIEVALAAFTVGQGAGDGSSSLHGGEVAASAIIMTACDFKVG